MPNFYNFSKRIFLLAVALTSLSVQSQTVYENSQDGKLWIRLTEKFNNPKVSDQEWRELEIARLSFLPQFVSKYGVTGLSKPFHVLKDSKVLQRTYQIDFSDYGKVDQFIAELESTGHLDFAERVPLDELDYTPNDYTFSNNWHLGNINAQNAWNFSTGNSNIKIAITDNAIQRTHTDLSNDIWVNATENSGSTGVDDDGNGYIDDIWGFDVADNDNNVNPSTTAWDHGTHVAGLAAATTDNNTGVAAIGFDCSIIPVKITQNSAPSSSVTHGYQGITYAIAAGADVINASWGGGSFSATSQAIIDNAYNAGIVVIGAAGNNGDIAPHYPAAYNHVIAVVNSNNSDAKVGSSTYGDWTDVSAPGSSVRSTEPTNTYGNKTGTSMASPVVAGLAGLMLSLNPNLTPDDIEHCMETTCDPATGSFAPWMGAGRIDANAAMQCVNATVGQTPTVDFDADMTNPCDGWVQFYDKSFNGVTGWSWNFGDGSPTSNLQNPVHAYANPGNYTVTLTATNSNGNAVGTKTNYINVTFSTPPTPLHDTVCKPAKANLGGTGSGDINWYGTQSDANPFWTATSYQTATLTSNRTYYISDEVSRSSTVAVGKSNNSGGGGYFTNNAYLVFDAHKDFELQQVTVYAQSSGNRTIELRNNVGQTIASKVVNIPSGTQTVNLNFKVPRGTMYQLGIWTGTVALYRNNASVSYPYTDAGNRVSIIQGSATGLSFYYFFYNWRISDLPCESPRVAVNAIVEDCSGLDEHNANVSTKVYPNPAVGQFNVELNINDGDQLEIGLYDVSGKLVKNLETGYFATGTHRMTYDASTLPQGLYSVRVSSSKGAAITRLSLIK